MWYDNMAIFCIVMLTIYSDGIEVVASDLLVFLLTHGIRLDICIDF